MTTDDRAQLAALGLHLLAARPVVLPLTDWRRDLERARAIVDPVVRARVLDALCAAQIAAVEELRQQAEGVTP